MSGLRSASDWKTRASMYMPPPAMTHAMMAPNGPVAAPKVLGKEKMPAPIIEPTTIAVSENSGIFRTASSCVAAATGSLVMLVIRASSVGQAGIWTPLSALVRWAGGSPEFTLSASTYIRCPTDAHAHAKPTAYANSALSKSNRQATAFVQLVLWLNY